MGKMVAAPSIKATLRRVATTATHTYGAGVARSSASRSSAQHRALAMSRRHRRPTSCPTCPPSPRSLHPDGLFVLVRLPTGSSTKRQDTKFGRAEKQAQ